MKARRQVEKFTDSRQTNPYPHLRELSLTYDGQTEAISLRPLDISSSGLFISTDLRFPEGAILRLRFRLTRTGVEIATRCEVCYCLGGLGFGVKFLDLSLQSAQAIERELALVQQNGSGVPRPD